MSLTIDTFKLEVAGLLNRDPGSLIVNGVDVMVNTVNRGMRWAQTQLDFERLRVSAQVPINVNSQAGTDLSQAVLRGTTTPVVVNKIKNAFLIFNDNSIMPIQIVGKDQYLERLARRQVYDPMARQPDAWLPRLSYPTYPVMYRQNNTVYMWPTDNTQWDFSGVATMGMDVYKKDGEFEAQPETFQVSMTSALQSDTISSGPWTSFQNGVSGGQYYGSSNFAEVGTYRGKPLFQSGDTKMWIYWSDSFPLSYSGCWLLSNVPGDASFVWYSPDGVNSFNATSGWKPYGFLADPSTSVGINIEQHPIDDTLVSDFWMSEASEWLQLYTIQYLQTHYIKTSDRWPVTNQMLAAAWQGVVSWNSSLNESMPSYDLD